MNKKPQTREEKIEMLQGIRAGRIALSELHDGGPWILEGSDVLNASSRRVISREQFEKRDAAGRVQGAVIDWGIEPVETLIHE